MSASDERAPALVNQPIAAPRGARFAMPAEAQARPALERRAVFDNQSGEMKRNAVGEPEVSSNRYVYLSFIS